MNDTLHRALSMFAADHASALDRDERTALLCWLQGIPHNIVILLPDDVFPQLCTYLAARAPTILVEVSQAVGGRLAPPPPGFLFDSPLEETFYQEWHAQALESLYPLSPQYPVNHGQYFLDFAYPPLLVGIELDGYTYHSDRVSFTRDRQRQRALEVQGWRLIRFSGEEVRENVTRCVQEAGHFLSIQRDHAEQRSISCPTPTPSCALP